MQREGGAKKQEESEFLSVQWRIFRHTDVKAHDRKVVPDLELRRKQPVKISGAGVSFPCCLEKHLKLNSGMGCQSESQK